MSVSKSLLVSKSFFCVRVKWVGLNSERLGRKLVRGKSVVSMCNVQCGCGCGSGGSGRIPPRLHVNSNERCWLICWLSRKLVCVKETLLKNEKKSFVNKSPPLWDRIKLSPNKNLKLCLTGESQVWGRKYHSIWSLEGKRFVNL